MNLVNPFSELASFVNLSSSREVGATVAVAEATLLKLECYINVLYALVAAINDMPGKKPKHRLI